MILGLESREHASLRTCFKASMQLASSNFIMHEDIAAGKAETLRLKQDETQKANTLHSLGVIE